jgi:hypothetical protein
METRLRTQPVCGRGKIFGVAEGIRHEAVGCGRLVDRLLHQRVPKQAAEIVQPRRRLSAHDEGVEGIEAAKRILVQRAALGRVRVGVFVVGEVRAVFQLAEQRSAMTPFLLILRKRKGRERQGYQQQGISQQHGNHGQTLPWRGSVITIDKGRNMAMSPGTNVWRKKKAGQCRPD